MVKIFGHLREFKAPLWLQHLSASPYGIFALRRANVVLFFFTEMAEMEALCQAMC